jgi:L-iditol 2-dehydrogenase
MSFKNTSKKAKKTAHFNSGMHKRKDMKTMKAVIYYDVKDIRIEQIPVPECGDRELRVKVDACAVCGTDMKTYFNGNPRIQPPRIMGHEFTGIIETVGKSVEGYQTGERVVMATSVSCHECAYCKKGFFNLCADLRPMGFYYEGGMAEYIIIPERALVNGHVIKVPNGIKAEHAALAEPLSCAVNSNENANVQAGDIVLIMGAGPLGLLNLFVARAMGASKIILSEVSEARLEQVREVGCDILVNPLKENLAEIVERETSGLGADVVIVAAPAAAPQEEALKLVRKKGSVCLFASLPPGQSMLQVDSRIIHYGEIRLVGTSDSTPDQVKKAVEFMQLDHFPADKIASHVLPLDDIIKSFDLMKSGEALRVVLKP